MSRLFFLTEAVVIFATISICSISLTIIHVQDADSQQQQQQRQQLPINAIFKTAENSTVGIITDSNDDGSKVEFDGTGFVYDAGGDIPYIVTNAHVVQDVQDDEPVEVSFIDGSIHTAEVKGVDPQDDIAVLQIMGNVSSQ
jgi:S1-C subfamily serine protease